MLKLGGALGLKADLIEEKNQMKRPTLGTSNIQKIGTRKLGE